MVDIRSGEPLETGVEDFTSRFRSVWLMSYIEDLTGSGGLGSRVTL